jgi:hypothetical protein
VQLVETSPRSMLLVDLLGGRQRPGSPIVGQFLGVGGEPALAERPSDRGTPVEQRSEDVEGECANLDAAQPTDRGTTALRSGRGCRGADRS